MAKFLDPLEEFLSIPQTKCELCGRGIRKITSLPDLCYGCMQTVAWVEEQIRDEKP